MERLPASERTREKLKAVMEGRGEAEDGRSALVRLAARLIIEKALEGDARAALGRDYYARGAAPGGGEGRGPLSRTAVSEITERLWAEYQAFAHRDLSDFDITYLFVDGIAERLHLGEPHEAVLAAWGILADGKKALLHLAPGPKRTPRAAASFSRMCAGAVCPIRSWW